jgi:DNA-binding transcriptional MerR regulator
LDKAPDAFRTISEVAEETNVPQHVLRFWESRFAQIRPMKRGGGRRYYRPDDVDLLRGVRHLLYGEGYTIRGVQRILREAGIGFVQNVWRPGAEPPPPETEEDGAGDSEAEGQTATPSEQEPGYFDFKSPRPDERAVPERSITRREPTIVPPTAAVSPQQRPGAKGEVRRKLETALDELTACRRIIDAALAENYSDDAIGRSAEI